MIMTSVSGHLLALDFVLAYKNWYINGYINIQLEPILHSSKVD